ncbi:MAG: hypothetical protein I3J02_10795 [Prevotella sp.]|nr:hypothetical protein [Prevotella sp.]
MQIRKVLFLAWASCAAMPLCAQTLIPTDLTMTQSLNGVWQIRMDQQSTAVNVLVPGNWDMQGLGTPIYPVNSKDPVFTAERPARVGEYHRQFAVPASWKGQQVFIAFDGAENGYTLTVNGQEIGSFRSAFNRSMFDITQAVNFLGNNDLKVVVTQNRSKGWEFDSNDDWVFGGLSRDVTLCAVPSVHFEDITIQTRVDHDRATVDILSSLSNGVQYGAYRYSGRILDAEGKPVAAFAGQTDKRQRVELSGIKPWSAESPYLYTLQLELQQKGKTVERYETRFGLREVEWKDGVFRINGRPVKIKGVNHHDESPVNGRAISEEEMLRDLRMMKAANINAIRASHYPPNPHFMDMCDSLGFYVICEVPFGFGEKHLGKADYLEVLKERAWYTVQRDKNRPSVVIWSIGNENPNTKNGFATARYVHQLDSTRPYVFPQTHKPFNDLLETMHDSTEMFSAHYPLASEYKGWSAKARRPIMNTEYAHALGTDMGQMQELVELWYADPKLAGGCVWEWADQGLLKKDKQLEDRFAPTEYVWLMDSTYYDMQGILGTDGIVYPDRTPQTDYYQVRKVYSPVKIIGMQPKDDNFEVRVVNRYDFTPLSTVRAHIDLMANARVLGTTEIQLDGAPGDTTSFMVARPLMQHDGEFYYYHIILTDSTGRQIAEKSLRINRPETSEGLLNYCNSISNPSEKMSRKDFETFFRDHFRVRIGKKNTICQVADVEGPAGKSHHLWSKNLLEISDMKVKRLKGNGYQVRGVFRCDSTHWVDGTIDFIFLANGMLSVDYDLTAHGDGEAVETGLTMRLSQLSDDIDFSWLGRGPFANYPGKDELSEFGMWKLNGRDLYFPGNRCETEIAVLSDKMRSGMALIPDSARNICVERDEKGNILLSQNTHVAAPFNKGVWAKGTVKTDGYRMKDGFTLMAVKGDDSLIWDGILGNPTRKPASKDLFDDFKSGRPFAPYRASYDQ